MDIKKVIFKLCGCCGVSGREEPVIAAAKGYFEKFAEVTADQNGNLYAVAGNSGAEKTILIDAHIDRIGFMVTDIDEKGFVKVDKCGGIDIRTLQDTELVLQNYPELTGVICCMPPHLSDGSEDKAVPMDKIYVDFGLPYAEITKYAAIGDMLTFKSNPKMLLNNRIACAGLDNRCGAAALLRCAEILSAEENLKYKAVFMLSSQEETFGAGAKTGAYAVDADEAVVVDVSFASQPDITGQYAKIELGKGPMICVSPVLNKNMSDKFVRIARESGIPYQLEPISGLTGTNADSISVSKSGVKTSVISVPQRNMHTPNEVISVDDVENTARLIADYIICGGAFDD